MSNKNLKVNNGCLNIFKLLILLYEDDADYDKVMDIFKNDLEQKENYDEKKCNNQIQVVINKYINALKIFGVKIHKEKNKFKLDNSLYSINYSLQDLKALSLILTAGEKIQDDEIISNLSALKNNLILRMDYESKNRINLLTNNKDFTFFYTDFKEQINKCRLYAKGNALLSLKYLYRGKERKSHCQAQSVLYDVKTAYLKVYDINKNEYIEIALPNILSIETLPNRPKPYCTSTTVLYKLTGRLAKTYVLKENEKLHSKNDNELIVINNDEPLDKLFSRLMRYSDLCEILTPKYLRNEMQTLISETLSLYENN